MEGVFIFVCDRGFVTVGEAALHKQLALTWHLPRSVTIRSWGTTKGLSQLKNGPTSSTVLDEVCERSIPFRSIIDIIHVTPEGAKRWKKALSE